MKPAVRRPRESRSCNICRARRVRCDKARPACSRCAASSVDCIYPHRQVRAKDRQAGQARESSPKPPSELGQLEIYPSGFSYYASTTFWGSSGWHLGPDGSVPDITSHSIPVHTVEGTDISSDTFDACEGQARLSSSADAWSRDCLLCGTRINLTCMLAMLPERGACDHLCNLFFDTVYPLMPILHLPSFVAEYRGFWDHKRSQNWHTPESDLLIRRNPTFLCLLFSILFAASLTSQFDVHEISMDFETRDSFSGKFHSAAMMSLRLAGFPSRATNLALAAYLFTQLQLSREEEFSDFPAFVGTSFRAALAMGLHRDAPASVCSPEQIATRRKLWWHVIHVDTMVASSSGLPPLFINERISTTPMICVGEDIATDDHGKQIAEVDVRHLVAACRYTITKNLRRVIRTHLESKLNSLREVAELMAKLDGLGSYVWSIINTLLIDHVDNTASPIVTIPQFGDPGGEEDFSLPSVEDSWSIKSPGRTVHLFRNYSSILLHLMLHKTFIALFHPFVKSVDRKVWTAVRQRAVQHSHAFLRLFSQLCNEPSFARFSWLYPGTYQPLQSLSLILADLHEYPNSEEASQSLGLVDAMFSLYRIGEGIVNSRLSTKLSQRQVFRGRKLSRNGQEAWTFLANMRYKVLWKMGLDVNIILPAQLGLSDLQKCCSCEEQAIQPVSLDSELNASNDVLEDAVGNSQGQQHRAPTPTPLSRSLDPLESAVCEDLINDIPALDWDEWDKMLANASSSVV